MDNGLPKLDSFEKFEEWWRSTRQNNKFAWSELYMGPVFFPFEYGLFILVDKETVFAPPPDAPEKIFCRHPTADNFWYQREAVRSMNGDYKPLVILHYMRTGISVSASGKYWWHFPHQALGDATKVAFTPSHEYGLRDRQVVMKLGKYLKKFYGDVLDDDKIRHFANCGSDREVFFAHTKREIYDVYDAGPDSCMVGDECVKCYAYKYPEDEGGDYEFGLAYLKDDAGQITARAMVSMRHKIFPRFYGDDGPILCSRLESMGYTKVENMEGKKLRLLHLYNDDSDRYMMPYLDGEGKNVYGVLKDSAGKEYWTWGHPGQGVKYDRQVWADNSDGFLEDDDDEERRACACCSDIFHEDDMQYSSYHEEEHCDACNERYYRTAYYGRHNDQTPVHKDNLIYCDSDDEWYVDEQDVLEWHDIVQVSDGSYYERSSTVQLLDGEYEPEDSSLIVECGESEWGDPVFEYRGAIDRSWVGILNSTNDLVLCHPDYIPKGWEDAEILPFDHWVRMGYDEKIREHMGPYSDNFAPFKDAIFAEIHTVPTKVEAMKALNAAKKKAKKKVAIDIETGKPEEMVFETAIDPATGHKTIINKSPVVPYDWV